MLTPNTKGALFMMGSMAAFTINDAFMKALGAGVPLSQAIVLRGLPTCVMMLALAVMLGALKLKLPPGQGRLILMRNVTEVLAAYFFLTAIFNMPFANAISILQVLPLTITLAGAVFLGEPVGWRRWTAILVGFCGVMLIVRPGMEGFTVYSLYVLAAVVCVTTRDILSRRLAPEVPSLTVALSNAVSVTVVFSVVALFQDWQPIDIKQGVLFLGASLTIIVAYFCAVSAVRVGELAVVAPFRYTALVWAMLLGVLIFGEPLETLTLIGACIVVVTGIYSFYREQALAKAKAPA